MHVETWLWWTTVLVTVGVLLFDVFIVGRRPHEPTNRECAQYLAVYIGLAVAFGCWVWWSYGAQYGGEFFAGLADGVLAVHRQPVHLHHHHEQAGRPAAVPADRAAHRHRDRAGDAGHLHRRRRGRDQQLQLGVLPLRRVPDLDRLRPRQGGHGRRRGRRLRRAAHRVVREAALPGRPTTGTASSSSSTRTASGCSPRCSSWCSSLGHDRPALRAGLDPGDLRADQGALPRLHRQRVRVDGPAPALLPHRRPAPAAGLPLLRPGVPAVLHRREAGPARHARERAAVHQRRRAHRVGPGDPDLALAGRHRGHPGRDRDREPAQGPLRPAKGIVRETPAEVRARKAENAPASRPASRSAGRRGRRRRRRG